MARASTSLIASAALAAAACAGPEPAPPPGILSRPLIGGEIAREDLAVVALLVNGNAFCTGTLISPSVILTAAHCIDDAGSDPQITAFFGTDVDGAGSRIGVSRSQQNLGWTGTIGANDVGLLLLNFPQDPMLPIRLNTSPADEHLGEPYRHVGFGVFDREGLRSDGQKREGTTTINGTESDVILSGDDEVAICFGDSGGPGLIEIGGIELVAGVHSYTSDSQCFPPSGDTRVDLHADSFIRPWVQDNDPVCGNDGSCAPIGCMADPDCEPCGADGNCTSGCALPDPDCPTSEPGEICQAETQCTTGLCVFWSTDPGYHFCSLECEPGGAACPSGMSCQSVQPFGNICYFDEDPPGLLGDECVGPLACGSYVCEDGRCTRACDLGAGLTCPEGFACESRDGDDYFCFAEGGGGGCAVAPRDDGDRWPWLAALALIAAVVSMRRRRRRTVTPRAAA